MKLKWKNKMFGFVLQHRSLSFGEGDGGRGQEDAISASLFARLIIVLPWKNIV